jgi:hypothetical protein
MWRARVTSAPFRQRIGPVRQLVCDGGDTQDDFIARPSDTNRATQ